MAKTTSNKSLRTTRPIKAQRRAPLAVGEVDDPRRVPGASGTPRGRRRPGRAAALHKIAQRTRSQRWRTIAKGAVKRRANPAGNPRGRRSDS
ncbi:MAG TPA: hypothetical protein VHD62_09010 [Opitutaceae bacterium]|nr:hypothetical protein [Opitutaceae bacterium]